jgi:AraC family transcriptional regulator
MSKPLFFFGPVSQRFGTLLSLRSVSGTTLRDTIYPARLVVPPLAHHESYFCIALFGSVSETTARGRNVYDEGSVHFHRAGDVHAARTGNNGFRGLSVVLGRKLALRVEAALSRSRGGALGPAMAGLAARCRLAHANRDAPALVSAVLELTAAACASMPRRRAAPKWLAKALESLALSARRGTTVGALAAQAGVHPVHFVRAFRDHVGCTPGVYLRRLRVEMSRRALESTGSPISQIALDCGFASQAHFTRVFHDRIGVPPGVYRRLLERCREGDALIS